MGPLEKVGVYVGIIVVCMFVWIVVIALLARAAGAFETKPKYDTSPIYCERELANSED